MNELKIGVLLPRSSLYPLLSVDILHGLKAALQELDFSNYKLEIENIGFGADENDIYSKTEKLLLQDGVTVVVAFMDHMAASKLDSLFTGLNRLLLVIDTGSHIPVSPDTPCRFTLSLHAALAGRITGQTAAGEGVQNNVFATSFYEAGYLQCFSFQRGIEIGGGKICHHYVIPFRLDQFNIDPLYEAIEVNNPDAVLALYSAEAGALFLNGYRSFNPRLRVPLYVSPFMLEETWLSGLSYPFDKIKGAVTWSGELDNEMNKTFISRAKQHLSIFSMISWEAGQFISKAAEYIEENERDVKAAIPQIENINFFSPRGNIKFHKRTHYQQTSFYWTEIVKDETTGNCKLKILNEISFTDSDFEDFITDTPTGIFSKWTNTYLCI